MAAPGYAVQDGPQPFLGAHGKCGVGKIRPVLEMAANEGNTVAQSLRLIGPRQRLESHRANAPQHRPLDAFGRRLCEPSGLENERTQPAFAGRYDRFSGRIPAHFFDIADVVAVQLLNIGELDFSEAVDAAVGRAGIEIGYRNPVAPG